MNTELQEQLDQFKAELRSIIACEGVTAGPWSNNEKEVVEVFMGTLEAFLFEAWDTIDAAFIARSRTITPLMAEIILEQVEWLEKRMSIDVGYYENMSSFARSSFSASCDEQITSILTKWKGAKV